VTPNIGRTVRRAPDSQGAPPRQVVQPSDSAPPTARRSELEGNKDYYVWFSAEEGKASASENTYGLYVQKMYSQCFVMGQAARARW
jgi:hypothetical protein